MGIERFFSSLKRDYNFITHLEKKLECEHILIDFNSIVHIISQFLLEEKKHTEITVDEFEEELIILVGEYIEELLEHYFHKKLIISIIICVDGVPSMAKIYEQKKRRYMGDVMNYLYNDAPSSTKSFTWSRNNISPGTKFMGMLMKYLKSDDYINSIKDICINIKKYIVSGIDIMGEGEMKILHHIEQINNGGDRYVVYSPDSDMILLLLMMDIRVIMLRYDQQKSTKNEPYYSIVDINKFKDILNNFIVDKIKYNNKKFDKKRIIMDIIFILTIFGDDFLPKLETVRVNSDINLILDHYIYVLTKYGYLLNYSNHIYSINTDNFLHFLKLLQKKEDYFLMRNARNHVSSNMNRIIKDIVGNQMQQLRDYIVEYIWKFIYFNKPKDITISPVNANKHISIDILKDYIELPEQKMNMSHFANTEYKNTLVWNKMIDIISSYYIEILQFLNIKKMVELNIYSNEYIYVESLPNILLKDIILYFYQTYMLPITIPLVDTMPTIVLNSYKSSDNIHKKKLNLLTEGNKESYMIENMVDKYYKIMNPQDKFYNNIYKTNSVSSNYGMYYMEHFSKTKINEIINDYMLGLAWVVSYYHNMNINYDNIDLTWYYRHTRSPLLKDIIVSYNSNILTTKFVNISNISYMTPLEHYIYVSPLHLDKDLFIQLKNSINISDNNIKMIIRFILSNKKYYYPLSQIYNEMNKNKTIDCSGSIYINKCHLLFMENYINMTHYLTDFRRMVML